MDNRELNSQDMDKVAGGRGKDIWLYTIEEIEQSPVFEGMKQVLRIGKNTRDLSIPANMEELATRILAYANGNGRNYRFSRQLGQEFIDKYLPLV